MSVVDFVGQGVWVPPMPGITINPALPSTLTINSTTGASDKIAMTGRVTFAARTGTKNINKVHFMFGTPTKVSGVSGVKVSLQDVDLANGAPIRPDGTADQSATITYASIAAGWTTVTLDANRTVTYGELLAVVWEWDTPTAGDVIIVNAFNVSSVTSNAGQTSQQSTALLFTSPTWILQNICPSVLLEFNDGSFGTLDGALVASAVSSTTIASNGNPDEVGLEFQLPFATEVDGMWALVGASAGADFDLVLYSGETALATVSFDANALQANSSAARWARAVFPKITLAANTTYRVAVKPTAATSVAYYYFDVNAEGHMAVMPLGTTAQFNTRNDGAWGTATQTRRLWAGIRISGIDFPAASGNYSFVG